MKAGDDRGELDVRSSSEVEVVIPVAQGKTTRLFAQSKEGPGKIRTLADSNNDVLAVTIEVDIHVGCCDRILAERQPRLVLRGHAEQQFRRRRRLRRAALRV
jgi:hypothetical protein